MIFGTVPICVLLQKKKAEFNSVTLASAYSDCTELFLDFIWNQDY